MSLAHFVKTQSASSQEKCALRLYQFAKQIPLRRIQQQVKLIFREEILASLRYNIEEAAYQQYTPACSFYAGKIRDYFPQNAQKPKAAEGAEFVLIRGAIASDLRKSAAFSA